MQNKFREEDGSPESQEMIREELRAVGIQPLFLNGESGPIIGGILPGFDLTRACDKWVVKGNIPLAVAMELWENPIGKEGILIHGDSNDPREEAVWLTSDGRMLMPVEHKTGFIKLMTGEGVPESKINEQFIFICREEFSGSGAAYILGYEIVTHEGLKLFVDTVRKYGLIA